VPVGRPNWHWSVAFPGRSQPSGHRGNYSDVDECKRRFKAADPSTPVGAPATPAAAAPKAESAPTPTTASPRAPASEATSAAGTSPITKSAKKRLAKHETDERKARRIAAKYGVYWEVVTVVD
jgi:hypothetical protein